MILTPVPDEKTRLEVFKVHTAGMPLKDINLENLAKKTEGYAGSDIESVCREAAIFALREDMESKEISIRHFEKAIEKVPPSISKEIEKAYSEMRDALSAARANQMKEEKPVYMG
jgi:transitional endoplasmic reticulum ATPase